MGNGIGHYRTDGPLFIWSDGTMRQSPEREDHEVVGFEFLQRCRIVNGLVVELPPLSVRATADALGVSPAAVRHHCAAGQFAGAVKRDTPRGPVWDVPARYAERAVYLAAIGKRKGTNDAH